MKDRVYFGTNTKMYQTAAQTVEYLRCLEKRTRDLADGIAQRFVIPSYTALYPARRQLDRIVGRSGRSGGIGPRSFHSSG